MQKTFDFKWFKVRWLPRYGWVVDRAPAVVVVPLAPDDRIWLVRVKRIPTGTTSWEVPGGGVDGDEDVVDAGLRELEEECGLIATGGRRLRTVLELAPGMGKFPHHVVVASGVVPKGKRPVAQREEGILSVRCFDRTDVRNMLRTGRMNVQATVGALTVSGWLDGRQRNPTTARRRQARVVGR